MEENMRRLNTPAHAETERFLARAVDGVCCIYFRGDSKVQVEAVYLIDPAASGMAMLTGDGLEMQEAVCPLLSISEVYRVTKDDPDTNFPKGILDSLSPEEVDRLIMIVSEYKLDGKPVKAKLCLLEDSREARDNFVLHVPALARRSRSQKLLRFTADEASAQGGGPCAPVVGLVPDVKSFLPGSGPSAPAVGRVPDVESFLSGRAAPDVGRVPDVESFLSGSGPSAAAVGRVPDVQSFLSGSGPCAPAVGRVPDVESFLSGKSDLPAKCISRPGSGPSAPAVGRVPDVESFLSGMMDLPGFGGSTPPAAQPLAAWAEPSLAELQAGNEFKVSAPPERHRRPSRSFRCSMPQASPQPWRKADVVRILVTLATLCASAYVLIVDGAGDGSRFRCDLAAVALSSITALILVILVLLEICLYLRSSVKQEFFLRATLELDIRIFCEVNAVGLLLCALLGHATHTLVQILTLLSAFCWVLSCCSFSAWMWRKGSPCEGADLPFMMLLTRVPRRRLFIVFLMLFAAGLSTMWFKSETLLGYDEELGRVENFFFTSLGSVLISACLCTLGLWLLPAGRQLLVYRLSPQDGWEAPPRGLRALFRATVLSWGCHFFSVAFLAFLGYVLVTCLVLVLTKFALRRARTPKQPEPDPAEAEGQDDVEVLSPVANKEGEHTSYVEITRTEKSTLEKTTMRKACRARAKRYVMVAAVVVFGILKVALMFVAFLFDVVFIEKCLAVLKSTSFQLVKANSICGLDRTFIGAYGTPDLCAAEVHTISKTAFSYGNNATNRGWCYVEDWLVVDTAVWIELTDTAIQAKYCADANWTTALGLDFYAIQPSESCGVGARRLQNSSSTGTTQTQVLHHNTKTQSYGGVAQIPEALENLFSKISMSKFGAGLRSATNWFLGALRGLVDIRVNIPRDAILKCTGLRRLVSACMVFGGVSNLLVIALLDVLSVLSATKEIASVRAGQCDGFLQYAIFMATPQLIEQVVMCILQIAINSLATFRREAMGVFSDSCGYLVKATHLGPLECPNAWALPVDIFAIVMLFSALILGLLLILAVFAGFFYSAQPARWAIIALFGQDIALSRFGADEYEAPSSVSEVVSSNKISRSRTLSVAESRKSSMESCGKWLSQLVMGFLISVGVWTTRTSKGFQIGRRQDWYEPIDAPSSSEKEGEEAGDEEEKQKDDQGDLVSWKSMYDSTSKTISMAWLPLPYGNLFAKGTVYLNQYVIFTFGNDGGESQEEPEDIIHHLISDTPKIAHTMNWCSCACSFAILLIINFDLLGSGQEQRLVVLSLCVGIVIGIAILRVSIDIVAKLRGFILMKGVEQQLSLIVEARLPERVANGAMVSEEDPLHALGVNLDGLCAAHKDKVIKACRELTELPWVTEPNPTLPRHMKTLLRSAKMRNSLRSQVALKLLKAVAAEKDVPPATLTAALLLLMHEALNTTIQQGRCLRAARRESKSRLSEATHVKGQHMQHWAQDQAKAAAVIEASYTIRLQEEAARIVEERQRRGLPAVQLPPTVRWLTLQFSAVADGTSVVTGQWTKSGKELITMQQSKATVTVRGEVGLTWLQGQRHDRLSEADVQVNSISTQIYPPPDCGDDVEDVSPPCCTLVSPLAGDPEKPGLDCELCGFGSQGASRGCCSKHVGTEHDLENAEEMWQVSPLGVAWKQPQCGASLETTAFLHEDFSSKQHSGTSGTSSPSTSKPSWVHHSHEHLGTSWVHEASPAHSLQSALRDILQYSESMSSLESMEHDILKDLAHRSPEWLVGSVLDALGNSEAAKEQRARALVARMLKQRAAARAGKLIAKPPPIERVKERSPSKAAASRAAQLEELSRNPSDKRSRVLQELRQVLACDPIDLDELSVVLEVAKQSDVEPLVLARAQEIFKKLMKKQEAALALVQATEARMIKSLRRAIHDAREAEIRLGEFPDESGLGVLERAETVLKEEQDNAYASLQEAIEGGGALKLRRAMEQAKEAGISDPEIMRRAEHRLIQIGQRKRDITLLKMAIATNNTGLLKGAIEECEQHDASITSPRPANEKIDLEKARSKLSQIDQVVHKIKNVSHQEVCSSCRTPFTGDSNFCRKCGEKRLLPEERRTCPNGHVLLPMEANNSGWACDERKFPGGCKSGITDRFQTKGMNQFHCAVCDYDLCQRCYEVKARPSTCASRPTTCDGCQKLGLPLCSGSRPASASSQGSFAVNARKQYRANASLRAALYQDPPEPDLLRLAITQARAAGVDSPDLDRAEALAKQEEGKEHILEDLRACAALRDTGDITDIINECRKLGVDARKLLHVVSQLIEEQAKVARVAGHHGLGNVVLGKLEKERRDLHNQVQEAHGRFRVLCRVRPLLLPEGSAAMNGRAPSLMNAAMNALGVSRLDKHTLTITNKRGKEETFKLGAVFGPDCIQAEVWNEMQGLVQSAVDGYNIAVLAAGPAHGGRTFTMMGSSSDGLGVIPRMIEALFTLRDRDSWRANLEVDVQLYEIYSSNQVMDLLGGRCAFSRADPECMGSTESSKSISSWPGGDSPSSATNSVRSFHLSPPSSPKLVASRSMGHVPSSSLGLASSRSLSEPFSPKREASPTASNFRSAETTPWPTEGMVTRRVGSKQELRRLVDEGWRDSHSDRARHVVLSIHITRTNKSTGVATKSRLTLVDLAGMGRIASAEVTEGYRALEELFKSQTKTLAPQEPPRYQKHALTRALQDCMGGNAKTILMLALAPNIADAEDALAAVTFASCGSW